MIINNNSITNKYTNVYSLNEKKIYLPIFQRGFSWKPDQTEKILEDIENLIDHALLKDKQLYLLDFIGFDEDGKFKLADGQQRLITLSILTKCIIDYAKENNITCSLTYFDIEYDDLDNQQKWVNFCNGKIEAPFKKVYIRLRDYVKDKASVLDQLESIIKENIYIYIKMTENADDAFDIFEQINTGGKPLSKDEIIKTVITQYSQKYGIKLDVDNKELKPTLTSYYKYKSKTTGTFNNLAIMTFLNKYVVCNKATFIEFENYIKATKQAKDLSIAYIAKQLNRTQLLDMIYAYESSKISLKTNRKIIDEVFLPLFLLCAIFTLKGVSPGGKVKTFLDSMVDMVKDGKSELDIKTEILNFAANNKDVCEITLSAFEESLVGKTRQQILKSLLLMDVIKSNVSATFSPELINLEHIYPQKPVIEWAANGWPVSTEEQEKYIHNIGNYIILNAAVNKSIQNGYITDKRDEYDRIIPNDMALRTPSNTVDFDEFEKGKDYITRRQKEIAIYIQSSFPCAKVFIK